MHVNRSYARDKKLVARTENYIVRNNCIQIDSEGRCMI